MIFYRRQNFEGMRECANVLYDFNAGASVIAAFVNQHDFFIQRSQLITDDVAGDAETWDRLADPDAEPPGVEPTLQSLVNEVKVVMQEESIIIKRAFPVFGSGTWEVFTESLPAVYTAKTRDGARKSYNHLIAGFSEIFTGSSKLFERVN